MSEHEQARKLVEEANAKGADPYVMKQRLSAALEAALDREELLEKALATMVQGHRSCGCGACLAGSALREIAGMGGTLARAGDVARAALSSSAEPDKEQR